MYYISQQFLDYYNVFQTLQNFIENVKKMLELSLNNNLNFISYIEVEGGER